MDLNPFASGEVPPGGEAFGSYDAFDPAVEPDPGPFLEDQDVLTGREHAAFHRLTRELFEERSVYDVTFGYNLARLNLDPRHPDAGFRYGVATRSGDDTGPTDDVLRAEFTPTTPFCPQSDTLAKGSYRAWNGLCDRHEFDRVEVRVHPMHHASTAINDELAGMDTEGDAPAVTSTDLEMEGPHERLPGGSRSLF